MTPVSLFTVALGTLVFVAGAATLLAPLRSRQGAATLDRADPRERPPGQIDGRSSRPFEVAGETLVRGFTLVVLGLLCLLWAVLGL
jgi:hypothetical protein